MLRAEAVELLTRAMRQHKALHLEAEAAHTACLEASRSLCRLREEIFGTFWVNEAVQIEREAIRRAARDYEPTCKACGTALVPILVERGETYCANCEEPLPR